MDVLDLYKNIFSSYFLIKYGYFDIKVNRIEEYDDYTQDSAFYSELFSLEKLSKEIKNQDEFICMDATFFRSNLIKAFTLKPDYDSLK